ncbi:MAG: MBL fold metallo-hydrolase [Clostridia bacterium]|nr:MBL fold metallo-hydrolase [Clostridia bacterium]
MKITWLGQAGLLFEGEGLSVMIDPYLSDSVEKKEPHNIRRVPVDARFLALRPDVMIFTHNHLDHYDPETVPHFITAESACLVLAPSSVYNEVRRIGGKNNYVKLDRHTEWTEGALRFRAVKAEHSDPTPIGVIIEDGKSRYYVTGDTLYNEDIFADIPQDIDAVFLPINGKGNNMNMVDAARFCQRINPKVAVPLHFGMFDAINPLDFPYEKKVIPEIYREIKL